MSEFKYLFSPLKIGATQVPNRIHFAAHMTNYAVDNLISDLEVYDEETQRMMQANLEKTGGLWASGGVLLELKEQAS